VTATAPFLRWAGGKRRLLPQLHAALPRTFGDYYEPFLGGGALFFSLPELCAAAPAVNGPVDAVRRGPRVRLNDMNAEMMTAYTVLRDHPDQLIDRLKHLAADVTRAGYVAVRAAAPEDTIERAARFIYLNRTGFNGLWRVNKAGRNNVPWGQLGNPTVCNEVLLRADSAALAGSLVTCGSYRAAVATAGAGDLVYLDPPYVPLSATASFTAYDADGFGLAEQKALAQAIAELTTRGVHVLLSNSDTPVTREIFAALELTALR
jgi:DNA adenine methylase